MHAGDRSGRVMWGEDEFAALKSGCLRLVESGHGGHQNGLTTQFARCRQRPFDHGAVPV